MVDRLIDDLDDPPVPFARIKSVYKALGLPIEFSEGVRFGDEAKPPRSMDDIGEPRTP